MALPNTEIYRQSASTVVNIVEAVQDLLIVGPAYHILDYVTDKASLLIGTYGVKDAASSATTGSNVSRPIPGANVITIADPPSNAAGAVLDSASVIAYLDTVYLEIGNTNRLDGTVTTAAPNEDLFSTAAGGFDFGVNGVRPGDRLVISDVGGLGSTLIVTIKEVGGYNGSTLNANQVRAYSNFVLGGELTIAQNGSYRFRVEKVLNDVVLDSNFVSIAGNAITIKGGATVSVDITGDGVVETPLINYSSVYIQYKSLRQDLAAVGQINDDSQIESLVGRVDERNPLAAALRIALANTTTTVNYFGLTGDDLNGQTDRSTAHQAALSAIESNDAIYCIVPLTRDISIVAIYRTSTLALSAPTSAVYRMIIASVDDLPTTSVVAAASAGTAELITGDPVHVFATATGNFVSAGVAVGDALFMANDLGPYTVDRIYDTNRLSLAETHAEAAGDNNFFWIMSTNGSNPNGGAVQSHGLVELDGNAGNKVNTIDTNTLDANRVGQVVYLDEPAGPNLSGGYWLITTKTNGVLANIAVGADLTFYSRILGPSGNGTSITFVDPGVASPLNIATGANAITVTLEYVGAAVVSTAQEVKDAIEANAAANLLVSMTITGNPNGIQATSGGPKLTANGVYAFYTVVGAGGAFAAGAPPAPSYNALVRSVRQSSTVAAAVTWRRGFRQILDLTATFASGLTPVIVGDNFETPTPAGPANSTFDPVDSIPVNSILSDNRLQFDTYEDIPIATYLAIVSSPADHYRVSRDLTPTLQVDAINAATLGLATEQLVRTMPPRITGISNVVNALTGVSGEMGGEFLAVAIGALTAALPVQKSLTRQSISGIVGLKFSNSYFTRDLIKSLSTGGNMVVTQQQGGALPIISYQTTTNITTLELQELSMMRCYHYTMTTLKNTFDGLIAEYNAIPETLATLLDTMDATLASIQAAKLPKIGAPIVDYGNTSVSYLEGAADTAEFTGYIDFPAPLNRLVFRITA